MWGVAGLGVAVLVFFIDYVLGGAQEAGAIWFQSRRAILDFITWEFEVYALVLVPLTAVLAFAMRYVLPIIEVPLIDADSSARWIRVWYWPGTLQVLDDEVSWREGRHRAYVSKTLISKTGLYGRRLLAVKRSLDADEILYTPVETPAYQSSTLARRLQREIQEHVVQGHKVRP